jgi:hypothetical protein
LPEISAIPLIAKHLRLRRVLRGGADMETKLRGVAEAMRAWVRVWARVVARVVALGTRLGACAGSPAEFLTVERACYRTLARVDCHAQPLPGEASRRVGFFDWAALKTAAKD